MRCPPMERLAGVAGGPPQLGCLLVPLWAHSSQMPAAAAEWRAEAALVRLTRREP